jgi:hypothetical protein
MEENLKRARFGLGTAWALSMTGAVLIWVGVAALTPRAEQGHVVRLDEAQKALSLATASGLKTFAISSGVGVQRFNERLSLRDVRPGQWVEVSVGATVTSIRIIREAPGPASPHEPRATSRKGAGREG